MEVKEMIGMTILGQMLFEDREKREWGRGEKGSASYLKAWGSDNVF
ncbi:MULTISPECIES: hypothetical protein [unclassified Clostridium]|nr:MULTISPECIES: hypothetical protein [unclassified Clostridium]